MHHPVNYELTLSFPLHLWFGNPWRAEGKEELVWELDKQDEKEAKSFSNGP